MGGDGKLQNEMYAHGKHQRMVYDETWRAGIVELLSCQKGEVSRKVE